MVHGMQLRTEQQCFGGRIGFYTHVSEATGTPMNFGVYMPPAARDGPVAVLYFLAGLTCNEETFLIKSGALRCAAEAGVALVAPDTSPRHAGIAGEGDEWDFGVGAGFYVDAQVQPWARNYRMYSYVSQELPALIETHFPVIPGRRGVTGHSMGGHGALTLALKQPSDWLSVSAFAPICNPVAVPWGEKAFARYLGPDRSLWAHYDATLLMRERPYPGPILVDQGLADQFLQSQLHPEALEQVAKACGQELVLRMHPGYDHSYWFIQSFIAEHVAWHAQRLERSGGAMGSDRDTVPDPAKEAGCN